MPTAVLPEKSEVVLSIPPKNIKRLDDPFDSSRVIYEALVPITEAAKLPIGNANPRSQNLRSKISGQIAESLDTTPEVFHLKNRGIWIAAESADYDNQKGVLSLRCPDDGGDRYGAIDGGHTLRIIQEFMNEQELEGRKPEKVPHVMLHIRVGIEDELAELAQTLNRSIQLKEYTLANYRGEFDELEKILRKMPFADEIDYKENGEGQFDIVDVLQRLAMFCNGLFNWKLNKHPVEAYRSKAKCLDYYLQNKKEFLSLAPIMEDCIRLPDQVERLLPDVAGSARFGNFQFAARLLRPKTSSVLTGVPVRAGIQSWARQYVVSSGVVFPITASLRVLVDRKKDGRVVGWKQDPVKFFLTHGKALFQPVLEESDKSPTVLGKKTELWSTLHANAYGCLHPED